MPTPKRNTLAGSNRAPMEGAREIGPANPNENVDVTIRLRSRAGKKPAVNPEEFNKPIEKRTILSRAEFEKQHGADAASIARIESFAHEHKLKVKEKSAARRTVILSGTVAAMNDAFGVQLKEYEHPGGKYRGRTGTIQLPAEISNDVEGVFGLDNRPQAKPHFRRRRGHAAAKTNAANLSYSPLQVATLYDFPTGLDGTGQCIALIELGGGYNTSDLSNYWSQLGLTETPNVSAVSVRQWQQ
jgi:kumamolisin